MNGLEEQKAAMGTCVPTNVGDHDKSPDARFTQEVKKGEHR
jgi:hypothetical protein